MTTPTLFLQEAAHLEGKVATLYRKLAERFGGDPELSDLFERLADEEESHKAAFLMLVRVLHGFAGGVSVKERFDLLARAMAADLDRALAMLDGGRELSPEDALKLAVKLESTLIESHGTSLLETSSEDLQKTLGVIHGESQAHRDRLLEFVRLRSEESGR